nr:unnamed protein product [Spirometra erinaceieuropaei]
MKLLSTLIVVLCSAICAHGCRHSEESMKCKNDGIDHYYLLQRIPSGIWSIHHSPNTFTRMRLQVSDDRFIVGCSRLNSQPSLNMTIVCKIYFPYISYSLVHSNLEGCSLTSDEPLKEEKALEIRAKSINAPATLEYSAECGVIWNKFRLRLVDVDFYDLEAAVFHALSTRTGEALSACSNNSILRLPTYTKLAFRSRSWPSCSREALRDLVTHTKTFACLEIETLLQM